ncbi:hypothetical protein [Sphingomonas sp. Leaf242]|uniref:hypothetical protein n=1 Tax=Sphingomonas sp. Leaf242 TaxID=1736304 RepID=UPI00071238F1|nr:hypothetical protein [Sphingomonas sp. Leaf242]KQO08136.1 hypothetical protein ASF09_09485 [Sphingomonas sp. Leaf242]
MKALFALTAAMLAALPASASAAGPIGGQFEMFDVAVQGNRVIGRYLEEQGTGPGRRCSFTFAGTLRPDGHAAVTAHGIGSPPLSGTLSLRNDELTLSLPQVNRVGGCSVPQGEPMSGTRTLTSPWIGLAQVTVPRARFRAAPTAKPSPRYVVQGDLVGILRHTGGAMLVEYASGEGRPIRGWIGTGEARSVAP